MNTIAIERDALVRYVGQIEEQHIRRDELNEHLRATYRAAKEAGFDVTTLRQIVRERRLEDDVRHDQYALLDAYRHALGMLADTPLGEVAMQRAANGSASKPKPFAEQPVHPPQRGRGRPRKVLFDQEHPLGTA